MKSPITALEHRSTHKVNVIPSCFRTVPQSGIRIIWQTTNYCPFKCRYCFTSSGPGEENDILRVRRIAEKIVALSKRMHLVDVLVTGGEPLTIIEYLTPALKKIKSSGTTFSFSTTLYDSTRTSALARTGPRVVNVSADVCTSDKSTRFKSNYERILSRLKILDDAGIPTKITAVVTADSVNRISDLLAFMSRCARVLRHVESFCFNSAYAIGRGVHTALPDANQLCFAQSLIECWSKTHSIGIQLVNWNQIRNSHEPSPNMFSVTPDGLIGLCPTAGILTADNAIGALLRDDIGEICVRIEETRKDLLCCLTSQR